MAKIVDTAIVANCQIGAPALDYFVDIVPKPFVKHIQYPRNHPVIWMGDEGACVTVLVA